MPSRLPLKVEQRRGVNAAGVAEFRLFLAHAAGSRSSTRRSMLPGAGDARGGGAGDGRVEPGGAAHAAARAGGEAPRGRVESSAMPARSRTLTTFGRRVLGLDGLDVGGVIDDAFAVEQSGGQILIVPGGAHGGAEGDRLEARARGGAAGIRAAPRRPPGRPCRRGAPSRLARSTRTASVPLAAGPRAPPGSAVRACRVHGSFAMAASQAQVLLKTGGQ